MLTFIIKVIIFWNLSTFIDSAIFYDSAHARHPDFYEESGDCVRPYIVKGELQIASLQCVGFGFDVLPDFDVLEASDLWSYDSLGL